MGMLREDPELWADYWAGRHVSEDAVPLVGLPMFMGVLGGLLGTAVVFIMSCGDRNRRNR